MKLKYNGNNKIPSKTKKTQRKNNTKIQEKTKTNMYKFIYIKNFIRKQKNTRKHKK